MDDVRQIVRIGFAVWLAGQMVALAGMAAILYRFWQLLGELQHWMLSL
ncbi:MAG TPA: hypothetical protein VIK99_01155 [Thermaerobacter sp.]